VLLVHDEPSIVDSCSIPLSRAGCLVTGTTSPHEAIELAIREPYDLLLSDIAMPSMSGAELLRTVKHLYPDMAGVLMTGHGTMQIAIDALRAGANGLLLKPFTASELRLAVEDALAKTRMLKENARLKALLPLYESGRAFYRETNLDHLTGTISEQIAKTMSADYAIVLLPEVSSQSPSFRRHAAFSRQAPPVEVSEQILQWVAATQEPLTVREGENVNLPPELSGIPRAGVVMYLPLMANGTLLGILGVKKAGSHERFSDDETEMLSIQAGQAAMAIDNALLLYRLGSGYTEALAVLANVLEARNPESRGHTERLSQNSELIAKRLGLSADEVASARIGAVLHDIGTVGVPDSILLKPGKLTAKEFDLMKRHPVLGNRLLAPIPALQQARAAVLAHHERYDGTGYPYGLANQEIPIAARIIAVADAFDAVTQTRVYRAGESAVRALDELSKGSGTQFDPDVVAAFFDTLEAARQGAR